MRGWSGHTFGLLTHVSCLGRGRLVTREEQGMRCLCLSLPPALYTGTFAYASTRDAVVLLSGCFASNVARSDLRLGHADEPGHPGVDSLRALVNASSHHECVQNGAMAVRVVRSLRA